MLDIKYFVEGLEATFIFIEGSRSHGKSVKSVLVDTLKKNDANGYSIRTDFEGVGHKNRLHSPRFFELADNPIELTFVDKPALVKTVLDKVRELQLPVFCVVKEAAFLNLNPE